MHLIFTSPVNFLSLPLANFRAWRHRSKLLRIIVRPYIEAYMFHASHSINICSFPLPNIPAVTFQYTTDAWSLLATFALPFPICTTVQIKTQLNSESTNACRLQILQQLNKQEKWIFILENTKYKIERKVQIKEVQQITLEWNNLEAGIQLKGALKSAKSNCTSLNNARVINE